MRRAGRSDAGEAGELRILNQFTETFSVNELAEHVQRVGRDGRAWMCEIKTIPNPRKEQEEHYYNPAHSGLLELGLKPHLHDRRGAGAHAARSCARTGDRIDRRKIMPRVAWNPAARTGRRAT